MRKIIGNIVVILVVAGIIKGLMTADIGADNIGQLALHIVEGVADLTVLLIPHLIGTVTQFLST